MASWEVFKQTLQPASEPSQLYPAAASVLVGATLASAAALFLGIDTSSASVTWLVALGIGGLCVGVFCVYVAMVVRKKLIKSLLAWQGWMDHPRSNKTKIWGLLLKFLIGKGPHKMFAFSDCMPKMPVPDLDKTLNKWLGVAKHLVSSDEYLETKQAVENFRRGQGPTLQQHLLKRYKTERNWFAEYWLSAAYLSHQTPIALKSNFACATYDTVLDAASKDCLAVATTWLSSALMESEMTRSETIQCQLIADTVPLCMEGYRMYFRSARIPGKHQDHFAFHKRATHIIVIRKGFYFKLDVYQPDEKGGSSMLNRKEIYQCLKAVCDHVDGLSPCDLPVGALTTLPRDRWCHLREKLQEKNKKLLQLLDSSIVILCLDDVSFKGHDELLRLHMGGPVENRWFDKTLQVINNMTSEGVGFNMEHAIADAPVSTRFLDRVTLMLPYENGNIPGGEPGPRQDLKVAERLEWHLAGFEEVIQEAAQDYNVLWHDFKFSALNYRNYGKGFMKKQRISPDSYVQMAFQVAYYRMHKETPKTYSATLLRMFDLGRTEQVHPTSEFSKAFVLAMDDPDSNNELRRQLLRRASDHVSRFRTEATAGRSCDRHLLGLYCASVELGMDTDDIFKDKAWRLPFSLSTSTLPMPFNGIHLRADVSYQMNSFSPTSPDGYGIPYYNIGEDQYQFNVSSWRSSSKADCYKMTENLTKALDDMKAIFD